MTCYFSGAVAFVIILRMPSFAYASINSGDTSWILTATTLVLFMTLPGLALFYAGLVQSKNVLSVLMHHFTIACLCFISWVSAGYSLAFSDDGAWFGDLNNFMMVVITMNSAFRHYS